jgi:SAM-dependent methyltransferase
VTSLSPSYHDLAGWYDALYDARGKDYDAEARTLLDLAGGFGVTVGSLLDVACGTGRHLGSFAQHVADVAGVDSSPEMLAIAAARLGHDVTLQEADLRGFDLGRSFDIVTCLFSSIGHVTDAAELDAGVAAMARHVAPGGLLLVEPWLTPETVRPGGMRDLVTAETEDGVIARAASSRVEDETVVVSFAWAVATPSGVATLEEHHRMPLFTRQRYLLAAERAGLEPAWREHVPGLTSDRALLIGRRPA